MLKIKRVIAILMVGIMLLALLSGCSSNKGQSNTQPDGTDEKSESEAWPTKQITLVIPFNAGGSVDRMARAMAPYLEKELGVPVIVENRPGASGQVGATYFKNTPDDGYTVLVGTQPYLSANILLQNADYTLDDFAILNVQQIDPVSILVNANSPHKTLKDLVEAIKANPGKLTWGTIFGGAPYIAGIALFDALGLEVREVTYDGGGAYRTALLGNQVDFVNGTVAGDQVLGDQARALTLYSEERFSGWPDAVPVNEALKDYGVTLPTIGSMRYVATHKSFKEKYPERWQKLVDAWDNAFYNPDFQKYMEDQGELEVSAWNGPEKSEEIFADFHALMEKYKDRLSQENK